jgi:hypothetical protein
VEIARALQKLRARQKIEACRLEKETAGAKIKSDRELLAALQMNERDPAFMSTLIGEYTVVWATLDPHETGFIPVVKLPELLRRLDEPLGVGPLGSLYKMTVRCAGRR